METIKFQFIFCVTQTQTQYAVKHNNLMLHNNVLHVAVHQNQNRAPLLQAFKEPRHVDYYLLGISPASELSVRFSSRKMELISDSETSTDLTQTPGKYPEDNTLHQQHGESLKTKKTRHVLQQANSSLMRTDCFLKLIQKLAANYNLFFL
jgi:hypothetical protein